MDTSKTPGGHEEKLLTAKQKKAEADEAYRVSDLPKGTSMSFLTPKVVALLNSCLVGEDSFEVLPRGECFNSPRQIPFRDGLGCSRSVFYTFRLYRPCSSSRV